MRRVHVYRDNTRPTGARACHTLADIRHIRVHVDNTRPTKTTACYTPGHVSSSTRSCQTTRTLSFRSRHRRCRKILSLRAIQHRCGDDSILDGCSARSSVHARLAGALWILPDDERRVHRLEEGFRSAECESSIWTLVAYSGPTSPELSGTCCTNRRGARVSAGISNIVVAWHETCWYSDVDGKYGILSIDVYDVLACTKGMSHNFPASCRLS
jgi:hypothetical protein